MPAAVPDAAPAEGATGEVKEEEDPLAPTAACPLCGLRWPLAEIEAHASTCTGDAPVCAEPPPPAASDPPAPPAGDASGGGSGGGGPGRGGPGGEDDEAMARRLAAEFAVADAASRAIECLLCHRDTAMGDLYILDECSHKFHRECIKGYVLKGVMEGIGGELSCPTCDATLTVRDTKDFMEEAKAAARASGAGPQTRRPARGTASASKRLRAELKTINKADPAALGFTVDLVDDSLYEWEVTLSGFDESDRGAEGLLARDLKRASGGLVVMRIIFPSTYPTLPPYLRVIRPRFQLRTGHVLIGGSICFEALTTVGWTPAMTVESVCEWRSPASEASWRD